MDAMPGRKRHRGGSLVTGPTTGVTKVYRRFLYLDGDQVLSALSGLGIGHVEAVLETSMEGGSGDFRVGLAASVAQVSIGKGRTREITQQLTRRQTIHSAVNTLLTTLKDSDGLVPLQRSPTVALTENSLVEFDADIELMPLGTPGERADEDGLLSTADQRTIWDRLRRRSQAVVATQKRLRGIASRSGSGSRPHACLEMKIILQRDWCFCFSRGTY